MSNKILLSAFLLLLFGWAYSASAHQPNYIGQSTDVRDTEPTVSKAYYGELTGQPAVYTVEGVSDFELDVNILSPDLPDAQKNYTVSIQDFSGNLVGTLNDPPEEWQRWYEEFGGDWYFKGPEIKKQVPAGTYTITVQNPGNTGKYSLAIGEDEVFPPSQTLHVLKELSVTKAVFFNEPWYGIFRGSIGKYLLIGSIVALAVFVLLLWLLSKLYRKLFRKI